MHLSRWICTLTLAGISIWMTPGRAISADNTSSREGMLEIMQGMHSPFRTDQMDALVSLGKISDKAVVTDFKVQELLLNAIKDISARADMRRTAMQSLLQLSRKALLDGSILDELRGIVSDKKDAIEPRLDAVTLIAAMGAGSEEGVVAEDARKKAGNALRDIATNNSTEEALRAAAYQAMGGFTGNRDALLSGISSSSARIRAAALSGMARYLVLTKSTENRLVFQIVSALTKSQSTTAEQMGGLDCLTAFARNGYQLKDPQVLTFLNQVFTKSKQDDLIERAAVCMLYTDSEQALSIAKIFLTALTNPQATQSVRIQLLLIKGLDNLIDKLTVMMTQGKNTDSVPKAIGAITQFLSTILTYDDADDRLLTIAIITLGGIPRAFDRERVVESLIGALKRHVGKATLIENSLMQYKRDDPLHDIDDKPDPEQWEKWFEANRANLKPGLAPYL